MVNVVAYSFLFIYSAQISVLEGSSKTLPQALGLLLREPMSIFLIQEADNKKIDHAHYHHTHCIIFWVLLGG